MAVMTGAVYTSPVKAVFAFHNFAYMARQAEMAQEVSAHEFWFAKTREAFAARP